MHRVPTMLLGTLGLLSLGLGCTDYPGPAPPSDEVYWPVGVVAHPNGQYVYVVNSNFDSAYRVDRGGSILTLDATTLAPASDAVQVGSFGAEVAVVAGADGAPDRLYAAIRGDDQLSVLRIDDDGARLSCPRGDAPSDGLACSVDGELGTDPFGMAVVPTDTAWLEALGAPAPDDVLVVAGLGRQLALVTCRFTERWADCASIQRTIGRGSNGVLYYPPSGRALVTGRATSLIREVDWYLDDQGRPGDLVLTAAVPVPSALSQIEMRDLALAPDGTTGYLTVSRPDGVMSVAMTATDGGDLEVRFLERIDLDGDPSAIVVRQEADRTIGYVALRERDEIAVLDLDGSAVIARIAVERESATPQDDAAPYGMTLDPVRQRLYVTLFEAGEVIAIDLDPASDTFRTVVARSGS